MREKLKIAKILGVKVHCLTLLQALRKAEGFLSDSSQHYIVTPNPEIVLHAWRNPKYRAILNKASLSIPDGIGLLWASQRLYGSKGLKERIAGVDFMTEFLRHLSYNCNTYDASDKSYTILLVGGKNFAAHNTALVLRKRFHRLKFHAIQNERNRHLKFIINELIQPDCIFIALGAPKQEIWIHKNLSTFSTVKLAMGVGGAFDMISGRTSRAPRIMRKMGIEWLWRLILEPWRIRRIFTATIVFPLLVCASIYPHLAFFTLCYNRARKKSETRI